MLAMPTNKVERRDAVGDRAQVRVPEVGLHLEVFLREEIWLWPAERMAVQVEDGETVKDAERGGVLVLPF